MRIPPTLLVATLCAVSIGAGYAQTASPTQARTPTTAKSLPGGMSFHYDALHDQISASGLQLTPSVAATAITPTTGTITVTLTIGIVSHFMRGSTYHCSLTAIGGILDTENNTVDGGIETVNGLAKWTGPSTTTCTLTIPYSWSLPADPGADSGLILAFGVAAVSGFGENAVVERSTLQLDGIENLPATGTTSAFAFNVTL